MRCNFRELAAADGNGDRTFRCARCGLRVGPTPHAPEQIHSVCGKEPRTPAAVRRLANFTRAAIKHVVHGSPNCTQAEIDARIAICHGCELYLPATDNPEVGVCTHKSCGCKLSRDTRFARKLAWRDSVCPLAKWPKL